MNSASSILGTLYRRLPTILLVFAGAIVGGLYYANRTPSEYLAEADILVPENPPGVSLSSEQGNVPNQPPLPTMDENTRIGMVGLLRSRVVHERMKQEYYPEADLAALRANVVADISRDSLLRIQAYGQTREEATKLANSFVRAIEDELQRSVELAPRRTLEQLEIEEPLAWEDYNEANAEMVRFLESIGSANVEADAQEWMAQRHRVEEQLRDLEAAHRVFAAQRPVILEMLEDRPEYVESRRDFARSGAYNDALDEARDVATSLAVARLQFRDRHPEVERLQRQYELAQERAREEAEMIFASYTEALDMQTRDLYDRLIDIQIADAGFEAQREILEERAEQLNEDLENIPRYRARIAELQSRITSRRTYAERVSMRRAELDFHLRHGFHFSVTGDHYLADERDAKPVPTSAGIIAFSAIGGLIMGIVLALFAEFLAQVRLRRPF